jgi:hypothetical protein
MSSTGQKVEVANKTSDDGVNNKRKVSPTANSVVVQVKKTSKIDPTAKLMNRLTAYKMACDIPRYGLTTDMAKKMMWKDMSTRARLLSVQTVMNNFIRIVVDIALDVTENQQKRTLTFIESQHTSFVSCFMIAYHPLNCFKQINDLERKRYQTSIEVVRLFENVWMGITNIPAGANCAFETVTRDAGIFVRFLQGYIDQREMASANFKTATVNSYKTKMNIIYRLQLETVEENKEELLLRCKTQAVKYHEQFKKMMPSDAAKIIQEHRTAFLKEHHQDKLLKAPACCASGFDGDVSRRLH